MPLAPRTRLGPSGVAVVSVLAALGSCAQKPASEPHNVLLICLDAVRADRLGCYGYSKRPTTPNLDRLAADSTVFLDASAAACWTKPSVPSFLTGTWPIQHGVYEGSARGTEGSYTDLLPDKARTLAESLEEGGWQTAAFIENAQLRLGSGIEQGFGHYEDDSGDAREIRWKALDWMDALPEGRPFFLYLHLLDTHFPYAVPDTYARMFPEAATFGALGAEDWKAMRDAVNSGERALSPEELEGLGALYDGALRYADEQLGVLFRTLERRHLWEHTIVCVVADHGEEFLEHGSLGHGHGLYQNLLRVPWILKVPGRRPARIDRPVSLVDLAPTLIEASGLRREPDTANPSRAAPSSVERPIFAEHKDAAVYEQAYREGTWKLIRRFFPPERRGAALDGDGAIQPGTRWKAELQRTDEGSLRAARLAPSNEPADDPAELKGTVAGLGMDRLEVEGIPVHLEPTTVIYGAAADRSAIRKGALVKAVGVFGPEGFVAKKIKLYPSGEPHEFELRGRVAAIERTASGGRLRIDDAWVRWDVSTGWSIPGQVSRQKLSRDEVLEIAGMGGEEAAQAGFSSASRLFDLASDPGEVRPVDDPERKRRMGAALDGLARNLAERRCWSGPERLLLDEATIQRLRALGYVR